MVLKELEKLGLNASEAGIYLALIDLGQAKAGEISKKAQINRTTVYDSLERLIKRGLVTYAIESNKKVFQPVSPNKILDLINEQEKIAKEILHELLPRFKSPEKKEESNIYKGKRGINAILQDILKCKEYLAFGSRGKFLEIMKHDFVRFQKRKKEFKIKSRVILEKSSKTSESVKFSYTKFRYIPNEFSSPTTTFVYGEHVAIIIWSEIPIATVLKSKDASESYSHYFELLWKQAKI